MHSTSQSARGSATGSAVAAVPAGRTGRPRLLLASALLAAVGVVASAGLAAAGPVADASAAAPAAAPRQGARAVLPAPTGSHQVGTVSLHLVDDSRADPWVAAQPFRELMVTIRYPARDTARHPLAPQLPPGVAAAFPAQYLNADGIPLDQVDWAATRSYAHQDAPVDRRGGPLPVVLYSPGAGDPAALNSTLADDLASRGYLVVTIDHTYEAPAVEFPGGRVVTGVLAQQAAGVGNDPAKLAALLRKLVAVRVADTRFVLDQLDALAAGHNPDVERRQLPCGLAGALDPHRIGMFGQSGGGFTAAQAMHDDPRIKAAADLDGVLGYVGDDTDPANPGTAATDGLDRPMLLMGSQGDDHHTNPSWGALWQHSTGWHRDLTLNGATETTYTDKESMLPQLARQLNLPPATVTGTLGTIAPQRAVAAQRAYLGAFFDRWLRGQDDHLLDQPSAAYPDVRFVR
ncbi:dienelactone hydrolase [Kitasatospora sp. GAS204A]|uniref:alpha/beta hydrolase family protein n=1 Tax=unclassified Kitasatospora TaxID=2633591 RepID=UPI00247545FF|nr:hydrolase [Kitasatospora sp. GAS204B]MDH6115952.1 dienelactone hydrolase [Kitasatospora sp. GAS204B]